MKTTKIVFWVTTIIIFLFEGVMTALTFNSPMAQEGMRGLGYPSYFSALLMVFKVLGTLALIIPVVSPRIKEWAYAGFGIDFIGASASIWIVGGFSLSVLFPLVFLVLLVLSYVSYHKILSAKNTSPVAQVI